MDKTKQGSVSEEQLPGGPAFPISTSTALITPGMSLRDWFAGMALGNSLEETERVGEPPSPHGLARLEMDAASLAIRAYAVADAMLKERQR